jgi:hypothetical protein
MWIGRNTYEKIWWELMDLNWIYNLSETLKSESELTHKGHS